MWNSCRRATFLALAIPGVGMAEVPPEEQALFQSVVAQLSAYEAHVAELPRRREPDTRFGLEHPAANGNRMPFALSQTNLEHCAQWLDAIAAMGCSLVKFDVTYPILTEEFHTYLRDSAPPYPGYDLTAEDHRNFYRWIAGQARARGLGIVVEHSTLLPDFAETDASGFFAYLAARHTPEEISDVYSEQRALEAVAIAAAMAPDYFTIADELTTQVNAFGELPDGAPVLDDEGWAAYLQNAAGRIRGAMVSPPRLGGGVGTWEQGSTFAIFRDSPVLDYVDFHLYPLETPEKNQYEILTGWMNDVQAAGKGTSIGEAWLYKTFPHELGGAVRKDVFARDVFSFWSPLDCRFLGATKSLSEAFGSEYYCSFWSVYMLASLEYETARDLTTEERLGHVYLNAYENLEPLSLSETGRYWQTLLTPRQESWWID